MISINNLTFGYSKTETLYNKFDLDIDSSFFGLVGINGAGKSTLLQLCLGLLSPQSGQINIRDMEMPKQRLEILKSVGVVHERPKFPSWTRANQYLHWVGQLRGLSRKQCNEDITQLLKEFDLFEVRDKLVSKYSAGMLQKFSIIQAILGNPELIFLDEPTSNLDVTSRYKILEYMKRVSKENSTQIVMFSHILSDLERFCDEIGILHQGRLLYRNTIKQLLSETKHTFYQIRIDDTVSLIELLESHNIQIMQSSNIEVIVENIHDLTSLTELLPKDAMVTPYKSKLEEKFTQLTDGEQL